MTILWILLSLSSSGTQRGNSAEFHQCWMKDYFNNSCDFSHSFVPETMLALYFYSLQAFYQFTLNHFHIPFLFPNLNLFACLFFQSVNIPFQRPRSQRHCLLHLVWWKIEYTGFQILSYRAQFIHLFSLFSVYKHSFEIVFNWMCLLILDTEKFLIKIEWLAWFEVSVESTSEFSLIFWSDLLCNSQILPTLSSVYVNSSVVFTALVTVICWTVFIQVADLVYVTVKLGVFFR